MWRDWKWKKWKKNIGPDEGTKAAAPLVGGAGGLIRGWSAQAHPSEASTRPWCNKNTIIERSPPPTTTYYTNNTLSFCLLMIYFLNISHTLDLISLLLKCKLGSLPSPTNSAAQMNFRTPKRRRRQRESPLQGCFPKSRRRTESEWNWPARRASSGASADLPSDFALGSSAAVCPLNSSPARARAASSRPSFSAVAAKTKEDGGTVTPQTESNAVQLWSREMIACWDSFCRAATLWKRWRNLCRLHGNKFIAKKSSISQERVHENKFTATASHRYKPVVYNHTSVSLLLWTKIHTSVDL